MTRRFLACSVVTFTLFLSACGDSESSKRRLVDTGKKYFASGKFKEASIIFRKAISKDPRFGEAYYHLGITDLRLGRYGDALRSLRRASELQPENEDAHARLGELYLSIYLADRKRGKQFLSDLEELSDRVLKRNPNSFEGRRMKGYIAAANQDFKAAAESFRSALAVKPDHAGTVLSYVQTLVNNGNRAEAESTARAFIEKSKNYGPMYDFLYIMKVRDKDIPGAEEILKSKLQANPKNASTVLELALHYFRANRRDLMKSMIETMTSNRADFPNGSQFAGDFYFRLGDLDSAYREYEAGLKHPGADKLALQRKMVEVLAFQGRNQEATQLAKQVLEQHPDDDSAKALRASLRLRGGDRKELDTAISEFQAVIARMPDNPVVRFNYGEALTAKGKADEAKVQFQEAIKLRSTYVPPKLALARINLAERDHPKALALADEILAQAPSLNSARVLRAAALMGNKDFAGSRKELDYLTRAAPDLKEARYLLARMDFEEKRFAESEAGFRKLWESGDGDIRGLLGWVEVLMATNRAPEAKQLLEKVLAGNPPNADTIRLAIANVAVRSRQYDIAVPIYQELTKQMPKSQEMWLRLGETHRLANRLPEALKAFETARDIDPQQPSPWMYIALVMEATKQKDKLRPVYEQILRLSPDNAIALNNLAYILADNGVDLDQALTYAQRAKQKAPNHPDIADTLGWVYIKKNLSDDAIKIFRDLLARKPDHVTWRYHLAMALVQKGDKLQARRELETALKNRPTKDEDSKIRELLSRIG